MRLVRPKHSSFRRISTGLLEATEETEGPRDTLERIIYPLKRFLIGSPLTTTQAEHERLTKFKALAVLSSDAISSVAYATEAILLSLIVAGSGVLQLALPISVAIVFLLCIVTLSYRQTIAAYPGGGGSYIVAKDNVGTLAVVASGLEAPWGLAFLPDGRALVSERDSGKLLIVTSSGHVEEVQRIPARGSGEGGLLGIALSSNYATDGFVYAYCSTAEDNRIVRFRLGEEPQPILTGIPVSGVHNGGRIAFGPDGMLYIGTGDATNRGAAQDRNSLAGKILRLTPDGGVPTNNPFPNNPVYSFGHRNVQGLTWDAKGQLYATEFGQNSFDEVNRIVAGGNYGWPEVEGNEGGNQYIKPVTVFSTAEASPSGAVFLHGGAIPQWEGNLLIAGLRGERLWRLSFDSTGAITTREQLLQGQYGRLRHVVQAPDGSLWVLTSNRDGRGNPTPDDDRILRLVNHNN